MFPVFPMNSNHLHCVFFYFLQYLNHFCQQTHVADHLCNVQCTISFTPIEKKKIKLYKQTDNLLGFIIYTYFDEVCGHYVMQYKTRLNANSKDSNCVIFCVFISHFWVVHSIFTLNSIHTAPIAYSMLLKYSKLKPQHK